MKPEEVKAMVAAARAGQREGLLQLGHPMSAAHSVAPTKRNLLALAARVGASVEFDRIDGGQEIMVEAPQGHHFAALDVHEVVLSDTMPTMRDRYEAAIEDVQGGFEPCTADTCQLWEDGRCEWWGSEEWRR